MKLDVIDRTSPAHKSGRVRFTGKSDGGTWRRVGCNGSGGRAYNRNSAESRRRRCPALLADG